MPRREVVLSLQAQGVDQTRRDLQSFAGAMDNISSRMAPQMQAALGGALGTAQRLMGGAAGAANTLSVALGVTLANAFSALSRKAMEFAQQLEWLVKGSTLLAARLETLALSYFQVGKKSGFAKQELEGAVEALREAGITTESAYMSATRMVRANIDLAKSWDLARVAQNTAVAAGIDSSAAFDRLILGIQRRDRQLLDDLGLTLEAQEAYQKFAASVNKSAAALTEEEKTMALVNDVLSQGSKVLGTYEKSMESAGKKAGSLRRHMENIREIIGNVFLPIYAAQIDLQTSFYKQLKTALEEVQPELNRIAANFKKLGEILLGVVDSEMSPFLAMLQKVIIWLDKAVAAVTIVVTAFTEIKAVFNALTGSVVTAGKIIATVLTVLIARAFMTMAGAALGAITSVVAVLIPLGPVAWAVAGAFVALSTAAAVVAGSMNAFKKSMEDANYMSDIYATTSRTVTDAVERQAQVFGVSATAVQKALSTIDTAVKNNSEELLKDLGITMSEAVHIMGSKESEAAAAAAQIVKSYQGEMEEGNAETSEKAYGWGGNIIVSFAKGMAAALGAVIRVLASLGQLIMSKLKGKSPPPLLPELDQWGTDAMNVYLDGWREGDVEGTFQKIGNRAAEAITRVSGNVATAAQRMVSGFVDAWQAQDFGIFATITDTLERVMRAFGDSSDKDAMSGIVKAIGGMRDNVKQAVDELRVFGAVSESTFAKVFEAVGSLSGNTEEYIRTLFSMEAATERVRQAQEALNAITEKYNDLLRPLNRELQEIRDKQSDLSAVKEEEKLREIIAHHSTTEEEKEAARLQLRALQLQKEMRDLQKKGQLEADAAKEELDAAQEAQEAAAKALAVEQGKLDMAMKRRDLEREIGDIMKGGGDAMAAAAAAMKDAAEAMDGAGFGDLDLGFTSEMTSFEEMITELVADITQPFKDLEDDILSLGLTWTTVWTTAKTKFGEWWTETKPQLVEFLDLAKEKLTTAWQTFSENWKEVWWPAIKQAVVDAQVALKEFHDKGVNEWIPALQEKWEGFTNTLKRVVAWFKKILAPAREMFALLGEGNFFEAGKKAFEGYIGLLASLFEGWKTIMGKIWEKIKEIDWFALLGGIIRTIIRWKTTFGRTILGAVIGILKLFDGFFSAAADKLRELWGKVIDWFKDQGVTNLWGALKLIYKRVLQFLSRISKSIIDWFKSVDWGELWARFKAFIQSLQDEFGLIDWGEIWEKIRVVFESISEWFENIDWAAIGTAVKDKLFEWAANAWGWISETFSSIWTAIRGWFEEQDWQGQAASVVNKIKDGLHSLIEKGRMVLSQWWVDFKTWFSEIDWYQLGFDITVFILDGLATIVEKARTVMSEMWGRIVAFVTETDWKQIGLDIITYIGDGLETLWENTSTWLTDFWADLQQWWTDIKEDIKALGEQIVDDIQEGLELWWDKISTWLGDTWDDLKQWWVDKKTDLKAMGESIVDNIIDGIKTLWDKVKTWLNQDFYEDGIKHYFEQEMTTSWKGLATDVIDGVIAGFTGGTQKIWDAVSAFAQGIIDAWNWWWENRSPSHRAQRETESVVAGFAKGFEKLGAVETTVKNSMRRISQAMQGDGLQANISIGQDFISTDQLGRGIPQVAGPAAMTAEYNNNGNGKTPVVINIENQAAAVWLVRYLEGLDDLDDMGFEV